MKLIYSKETFKIKVASLVMFSIISYFVMAILTYSLTRDNYNPNVILSYNSGIQISQPEPKTEVQIGFSKNDLDQLNQNPNPETIKQFMCAVAPEYGVDWKLVFAIGYHESGDYHSSLAMRNNNYFGRKSSSGSYASWATPEDAIRNQFEYIKNNYYSRGLTTPKAINPIYAEDSSWQYAVSSIMNTL